MASTGCFHPSRAGAQQRLALTLGALAAFGLLSSGTASGQRLARDASDPVCSAPEEEIRVPFHGKTLVVAPDISNPQLRFIDAVISRPTCMGTAGELLATYAEQRPDDYQVQYLQSRMLWISGDMNGAQRLLLQTIAAHPDFASAKILLASILMENRYYETLEAATADQAKADVLLQEVAARSPTDLWGAVDRGALAAIRGQNSQSIDGALEILRNAMFPGDAREVMGNTIVNLETASPELKEQTYRELTTFESRTPQHMKATNLAQFLIEARHSYKAGRQAIGHLVINQSALGSDYARLLTAESYLLEAAAIDPAPSTRNAALVQKASAVMNGDLSGLAPRVSERTDLSALLPFLTNVRDPNARDENGNTALCNAVARMEPRDRRTAVLAALDAGADVNAHCEYSTPLGQILMSGLGLHLDDNQALIQMLLDHGADPDPAMFGSSSAISYCKTNAFCKPAILPLLESHAGKAAATEKGKP